MGRHVASAWERRDVDDLDSDPAEALATWRADVAAILVHTRSEYARHDGQADLLWERIDGATGV